MDRRRRGLFVLTAGVFALVLLSVLSPPPESARAFIDRELSHENASTTTTGVRLVIPAVASPTFARYDAATDTTTIAPFMCGHSLCGSALRLDGDVRDRVTETPMILTPVTEGTMTLEPFTAPWAEWNEGTVTTVVSGRLQARASWLDVTAFGLAFATAGVGASLAAPSFTPRARTAGAVAVVAGVATGPFAAGVLWGIPLQLASVPVAIMGLAGAGIAITAVLRRRPAPPVAVALAFFAGGFIAFGWFAYRYFPPGSGP